MKTCSACGVEFDHPPFTGARGDLCYGCHLPCRGCARRGHRGLTPSELRTAELRAQRELLKAAVSLEEALAQGLAESFGEEEAREVRAVADQARAVAAKLEPRN